MSSALTDLTSLFNSTGAAGYLSPGNRLPTALPVKVLTLRHPKFSCRRFHPQSSHDPLKFHYRGHRKATHLPINGKIGSKFVKSLLESDDLRTAVAEA